MGNGTAYATVEDIQERITRTLSQEEQNVCSKLLEDAAVIIDSYNTSVPDNVKALVSCRMVMRALPDSESDNGFPIGASQGSKSGLGYSQSWTMGSGSVGELYLTKVEKRILGIGDSIGSYSPVQELVPEVES